MADVEARQRAKDIVNRRNLGALANDTKWGEFFDQMARSRVSLEFKFIDEERTYHCGSVWVPAPNYVEGSAIGPYLFIYVEWVRSRSIAEVAGAAASCGLECFEQEGVATVYGYR
jgi:hypothetical protein